MPNSKHKKQEKFFVYYKGQQIFWFRIYGYGLSIRSVNHGFIPFSMRYGFRKVLRIFDYYIEFLKPFKN